MERQVIFRDRQELQAADLSNIETDVDESLQHLILDAISGERHTVGLAVTKQSATELQVGEGRLWAGDQGKVYALTAPQTVSVYNQLPVTDQRYLAVSCYGQEVQTDIQPRDFLIDLSTGQTEPQAVAMAQHRQVVTVVTAGVESPTPQKPSPPTGYTLLAYVLLTPAGIDTIELNSAIILPHLFGTDQRLQEVEGWRDQAGPAIATLGTDVAALGLAVQNAASQGRVSELAADVARLKEVGNLPVGYSSYAVDHFLADDQSDTGDVNYHARIEEGIRFPWDAVNPAAMQLLNPLEPAVVNKNGLLLPPYAPVARLSVVTPINGSLALNAYQYQTVSLVQGTLSRTVIRYGAPYSVCTNSSFWRTGVYDPITRIFTRDGETYQVLDEPGQHRWVRVQQFWTDTIAEPYWYHVATTQQISGAVVAETLLNQFTGWVTGVGLRLTQVGSDGPVTLALCQTRDGLPDLDHVVGSVTLQPASLHATGETYCEFARPVFVTAGRRYAVVVITSGAHRAATVDGNAYTQGTLFYGSDGAYMLGDLTKDLAFTLYYARFSSQFAQVQVQPLSLSGGITAIDVRAGQVVPETCAIVYEYQLGGIWRRLDRLTPNQLTGLPPLLPFRVTLIGTSDLMPGLEIQGATTQTARPALTFEHRSLPRSLSDPHTQIQVQMLLEGWDDTHHTCGVALISGGTTYTPDTVVDTVVDAQSIRRTATFNFTAPGISGYVIKTTGATDTALITFHVAERVDIAI